MNRWRAVLLGTGVVMMGHAVLGALTDPQLKLGGVVLFLVAVLVAHDAVWLPLVLAAGWVLDRVVPVRHRGPVRVAGIAAAALTVSALPLALGRGRTADNPSALPLDYGRNLLLVLLAVAVTTTAVTLIRARNRKDSESGNDGSAR